MRKHFFATLVLLGIATALFAAPAVSEESAPNPAPAAAAKLIFEESTHDFGTLGQRQKVKHIFKFRNDGDALLVIDNVKASCGCTGTLLSQSEIPPGEAGEIEVTFKSQMSSGKKKKSIDVSSNDPENPSVRLYITADISVPVEVRPRSLYWTADKGEPSSRTVQLLYQPDHETKIVKLESSSPAVTATYRLISGDDALGYDVEITFDGSLPVGRLSERLTILTDSPEHPRLQVLISGSVTGPIRVVPNSINFGVIRDRLPPPRYLRVYAKEQVDFKISAIEPEDPLISAELTTDEATNGYRVGVKLTGKPPRGGFSSTLRITTDEQPDEPIEVLVYAFVQ